MKRREFLKLGILGAIGAVVGGVAPKEDLSEEGLAAAAESLRKVAQSAKAAAKGLSEMTVDLANGQDRSVGYATNGMVVIDHVLTEKDLMFLQDKWESSYAGDVSFAIDKWDGSLDNLHDTFTKLGPVHVQYVAPPSNCKCDICGRPAQHQSHDVQEVESESEYRMWEPVGPAHSYCNEHISESDFRDGLVKAWT